MGYNTLTKTAVGSIEFDPSLDMVLADSWWGLGRLMSKRSDQSALKSEVEELRKAHPDYAEHLVVADVRRFLDRAYELLRKKYEKQSIAKEVVALVKCGPEKYRDDGQYLECDEPRDVFWALEYGGLFSDMYRLRGGGEGWLNAAAICRDEKCAQRFFIRSRSNQEFCSYNCRMRSYGRDTYVKKKHSRSRKARKKGAL